MRALILCAGEGRRLRPLTQIVPKPLIPVAGVPMVVRQILALRAAGIQEFVLNIAHGARILMAQLGDGAKWGVRITWSVEGFTAADGLETRGGIVKALPLLAGEQAEPFIAVAGDIVTDFDYRALVEKAQSFSAEGILGHLVLVPNPDFHACGDFALEKGKILRPDGAHPTYTFSSLALYHPALFAGVAPGFAKLFPWMLGAIDAGRITGSLYEGLWANVGTPLELDRAEALLRQHVAREA